MMQGNEQGTGFSLLIGGVLAALAFGIVLILSAWAMPFLGTNAFDNLYFHADNALVFANMTDFNSNHYRTGMHPGFSLFAAFSVEGLRSFLETGWAARALMAVNAAAQTALLLVLLRRIGLDILTASTFVLLFLASASLMFWHTIPETFAFGGTTLLIMLWIAQRPAPGNGALVLGNVIAMSMTMTNWMAAFYGTIWHRWMRLKTAFGIFAVSGAIIVAMGVISKLIFPSSGYVGDFRRYLEWIRLPQPGDWPAFFGHSIVMPEPIYDLREGDFLAATVETASLGSGTVVGPAALGIWAILLLAGIVGLWRARHLALSAVLGLTAISQLGLHSFFSDGPFLFAAHFGPLLVLVAAHAALLPRLARPVLAGTALLVVLVGCNNLFVFDSMTDRFETDLLPRLAVETGQ